MVWNSGRGRSAAFSEGNVAIACGNAVANSYLSRSKEPRTTIFDTFMSQSVGTLSQRFSSTPDDVPTVCAIGLVATMTTNILHEGIGHGLTALLSGAQAGLLTTVAWSSAFDSRLVQAAGTLVNLAAGLICWFAAPRARVCSVNFRYFLLMTCALNLFTGTGYFLFSGISNFGDWAEVISGLSHSGLWRALLVVAGLCTYLLSVRMVGVGLIRDVAVARSDWRRLRTLTVVPYISAVLILSVAALRNPLGIQLFWQSALPAAVGGQCGLLWLRYYIPRTVEPAMLPESIARSYGWITIAIGLSMFFIFILGSGIKLHR
jgi:hypothetical protein